VRRARGGCGISQQTAAAMSDTELEARLYPPAEASRSALRPAVDWPEVQRHLKGKNVTLQLLWEEYREREPHGTGKANPALGEQLHQARHRGIPHQHVSVRVALGDETVYGALGELLSHGWTFWPRSAAEIGRLAPSEGGSQASARRVRAKSTAPPACSLAHSMLAATQTPRARVRKRKTQEAGDRRLHAQAERAAAVVRAWKANGKKLDATAAALGMARWSVQYFLGIARQRWLDEAAIDLDAAVRDELANLARIETQAQERYEQLAAGNGTALERAGADRYLRVQQECIAQRRELLGLC
jgi:hypothetical protein